MKFLVSCCNKNPGVFLVNFDEMKQTQLRSISARGIAFCDKGVFIAEKERIAFYWWDDERLIPSDSWDFPGWDVHDIRIRDGMLYVNNTGENRIMRMGLFEMIPEAVCMINKVRRDICHVNSLTFADSGALYGSAFTFDKRRRERWRDVRREGFIFRVRADGATECLKTGVDHPHSVRCHDRDLFYCESKTSTVHSLFERMIWSFKGYLRGLHVAERCFYVGRSRSRIKSDDGPRSLPCAVIEHDRVTGNRRSIELGASEIFDIVEVPQS